MKIYDTFIGPEASKSIECRNSAWLLACVTLRVCVLHRTRMPNKNAIQSLKRKLLSSRKVSSVRKWWSWTNYKVSRWQQHVMANPSVHYFSTFPACTWAVVHRTLASWGGRVQTIAESNVCAMRSERSLLCILLKQGAFGRPYPDAFEPEFDCNDAKWNDISECNVVWRIQRSRCGSKTVLLASLLCRARRIKRHAVGHEAESVNVQQIEASTAYPCQNTHWLHFWTWNWYHRVIPTPHASKREASVSGNHSDGYHRPFHLLEFMNQYNLVITCPCKTCKNCFFRA
jgi:hypothetical protein